MDGDEVSNATMCPTTRCTDEVSRNLVTHLTPMRCVTRLQRNASDCCTEMGVHGMAANKR